MKEPEIKVAVVTGGGHGIGRALCRRLANDGALVVVADIDESAASVVAAEIGGVGKALDVSDEKAIVALVEKIEKAHGPIDMFISNAGVGYGDGASGAISAEGGMHPIEDRWDACWQVNVMAHVFAARAMVPRMLQRGHGHLVNTASAAGLLSQIGDSAYSATKHAAVGFAESLAIDYGDAGIVVSVVCPQAVATRMIGIEDDSESMEGGFRGNDVDGIMRPEAVADIIIDEALAGRFLILTHPQVTTYVQRKASDHDRWISGMQRFRKKLL
ncbi:MAG: SDR family oxidoreductase [Gammaproteobacteria bacterium]|nr:SDR family oxidoreductase [Gammaproteobacteria bacterium]MBT8110408.1 SDR family oxidoreductase [Gammaproteobacteria bacterium]NND46584.1 SDR family oxidoreductase [Woeseiaceae bacterium]NNL45108.1 SDR family oxidoreductase [Woeseiaceae bacterium]